MQVGSLWIFDGNECCRTRTPLLDDFASVSVGRLDRRRGAARRGWRARGYGFSAVGSTDRGRPRRVRGRPRQPGDPYHAADLIVLPSRGGDSMPATLIEAGFCALHAVATPIGSITDVVTDGVTGTTVPNADSDKLRSSIARSAIEHGLAAVHGEAARKECLDDFEMEAVARRFEEILGSIAV